MNESSTTFYAKALNKFQHKLESIVVVTDLNWGDFNSLSSGSRDILLTDSTDSTVNAVYLAKCHDLFKFWLNKQNFVSLLS